MRIKIGEPYIEESGDFRRLKARISIPTEAAGKWLDYSKTIYSQWRLEEDWPPECWKEPDFSLWFGIENKWRNAFLTDRADGHVVAMLYFAMITGADIESEAPVSSRLLYSINFNIIPILCNEHTGFRRISVIARPAGTPPGPSAGFVGTGMTCGIDSFHTLLKHTSADMQPEFRLTHLAYLKHGSIFHPGERKKTLPLETFNRETDALYRQNLENARKVADACGLGIVYIESNMDRDIYRGAYGFTAVYRNCALILATQGLWKTYFNSSSGCSLDWYNPSLRTGSADMELTLLPGFSNGFVDFLIGSGDCTRFQKLKDLIDFPLAQKYLDVCWQFEHCGRCGKCYRTLISLEILGALDKFREVFDIDRYRTKDRNDAFAYLLAHRHGAAMEEIWEQSKAKGIHIPSRAYLIWGRKRVAEVAVRLRNRICHRL